MSANPLIEALVDRGSIEPDMLKPGGVLASTSGLVRQARAEVFVLTQTQMTESELLEVLADVLDMEAASEQTYDHIEADSIEVLPDSMIREYRVIPVRTEGDRLIVYTAAPLDETSLELLEEETGLTIEARAWPAVRYFEALSRFLGDSPPHWLSSFLAEVPIRLGLHEDSLVEQEPEVDWGKDWKASEVSSVLRDTYDRDIVLKILLGFSSEWFESSAVLVVGNGTVQAVFVRDWPIFESVTHDELKRTRASVTPKAPAVGLVPARGTVSELGLDALFDAFGTMPSGELVTVPVPIGNRVAMVLLGKPRDLEAYNSTQLEATSVEVGEQLESVIKLVKSGGLPAPEDRIPQLPSHLVARSSDESDELEAALDDAMSSIAVDADPDVEKLGLEDLELVEGDHADPESDIEELDPSEYELVDEESENFGPGVSLYDGKPDADGAPVPDTTHEFRRPNLASLEASSYSESDDGHRMPGLNAPDVDEATANATMFGLPLAEKKSKEKEPEADANSTMFGLPLVEQPVADSPEDSSGVSSAEEVSETQDPDRFGNPPESDVMVMKPQDVGQEASDGSSTLMGGIEAAVDMASDLEVRSGDRAPIQGTIRGGVEPVALEESSASEEESPKGGLIPGMMILKPARGKVSGESTTGKGSDSEQDGQPRARKRTPNPATTLDDYGELFEKPASEASEPRERSNSPKSDPQGLDDDSAHTAMGMQDDWADVVKEEYRRKNEEVHEAWFDYFAAEDSDPRDVASQPASQKDPVGPEPPKASAPDDDEPRTIPPETLERLLESGPDALELQDDLMELESPSREVAFRAADRVGEAGTVALEALAQLFPGRLFVDRYQHTIETMPALEEHGPVLAALVRIGGDEAALVAARHLGSTSNERRFYATYLLTEAPAELALSDLVDRVFDKDKQTRDLAAEIVKRYARSAHFTHRVLEPLRAELTGATEDLRVEISASLLAELRDVESIPLLIEALGEHGTHANKAVQGALEKICVKSWSSAYEWQQWWATANDEPRETWIIEAMDSSSKQLRSRAFDEIQRIPGLELSYHPEQPANLRKEAQETLRKWLAQDG